MTAVTAVTRRTIHSAADLSWLFDPAQAQGRP